MYADYADIRDRIAELPFWFDQNGVPRYGPYRPASTTIYAQECALLEIECQGCRKHALVGVEFTAWEVFGTDAGPYVRPSATAPGSFSYGDFPRWLGADGEDCCSGVTMSTGVVRIVEFWVKAKDHFTWERHPDYEFSYPADAS